MPSRLAFASVVIMLCGCAPGLALHPVYRSDADTIVFARSITRAGHDSAGGMRRVVLHVLRPAGRSALLEVEQRFPGGGGEIIDTAVADLATLHAVAHRSHQPARTMRFEFDATSASGRVTTIRPTGDSVADVRQLLGGPIFDSNVIDLVVAALPLRAGFHADLPFFIYERGGRVVMPVAVRERSSVAFAQIGRRDAWIVTVGVPGAPATVWVDARSHRPLRVRYDVSGRDVSFTDERITPL